MGVNMIHGGISVDDRGSVRFVNDFDFAKIKRFYQVENHQSGFIRAWHGHLIEKKYVYVAKGSALIGAVNLDSDEVSKFILTDKKPSILHIPNRYANGFKTLEPDTILIFFSTLTVAESVNDDVRYPYNQWNIWNEEYR